MIDGLKQEFAELEFGDHLGLVYQSPEEKMPAIARFIKKGLALGAYCVYVADESTAEEIVAGLRAYGLDLAGERQRGNFHFLSKWEYRRQPELRLEVMSDVINGLVGQALAQDCPGLWLTVEMTWTLEPDADQNRLLQWEALLNTLLERSPAAALCMYNASRLAPPVSYCALRTHPHMILGDQAHPNLYYEPPDLAPSQEVYAEKVDWMLAQLQRLKEQQQTLAESEKRYRLLADNAKDVVFRQRLIPEFRYEYISPSVTAFTGYTPEDFYQDPDLRFKLVHPEDRGLSETLRQSPESYQEPVAGRWTHRDGTVHWGEANVTPIYDQAGNLAALEGIVRDITQRKQVEEELRFQSQITERMAEGIVVLRASDGVIVYTNAGFEKMLGYDPGELMGKPISVINAPGEKNPEEVAAEIIAALNEAGVWRGEVRNIRKDGTPFWSYISVSGFEHHEHGKVWISSQTDITERKQAQEELARRADQLFRSREQFRLLVEGVKDYAIFRLDPSGYVSTWNAGAQQIKGYQPEEIIGQHYSRFFPEEDIQKGKPIHNLQLAAARGRFEDEGWRVRKDGARFWANVVISALRDQEGQLRGFTNVTRDMTERKKAEEERIRLLELTRGEEERQRLKTFIDASPVGVMVVDAHTHRLELVNPEVQRLRGPAYQPGKLLDECAGDIIFRKPDGQVYELEELPLFRALAHRETVRAEELLTEFPDGRTISTLVNATPVLNPQGQITSAIGIIQDLTPLEELERLRHEFLGMVSHELKMPLAAVKGVAATALRSRGMFSPGEVQEFFEIVEQQADHLTDLVNDLLDVSRIEIGALSVNPEPANVQQTLEDAIVAFNRSGNFHQVQVVAPDALPPVSADRRRLVQVLSNLLGNAAKYSPPTAPITIEVEYDLQYLTVHVRDRGRGIPREKLTRLFRKFSEGTDVTPGAGTGLGLVICKGIVEAHGGRIWADSLGEGKGATFSFTLPVAEDARLPSLAPSGLGSLHIEKVSTPPDSRKILVVDDDLNTLRFLRRLLEKAEYQPVLVSNPAEVIEQLELARPDLVMLDLMLPGSSGFDLLQQVKEISKIPVIMVTARSTEADTIRALSMGADDYITKPFSPSEFLARLEAVLRRSRLPEQKEVRSNFVLDGLTFDFAQRRVTRDGQQVSLSRTEYKLFHQLASNAGRVLPRDLLLQQVWGPEFSGESELLRTTIRRLRRKLGDDARQPSYILTEPQVGYFMPQS